VKEYIVRFTIPVLQTGMAAGTETPVEVGRAAYDRLKDSDVADFTSIIVYDLDTGEETGLDPLDLE
jgi:hypothetical protein